MKRWLLTLGLASCSGCPQKAQEVPTEPTCDLLWERDVVGFFRNWCAPCHSTTIEDPWRQGAPVGVNFDSLAGVRAFSSRIEVRSLGPAPTMPPAGGPSEADRALVAEWIACGMPGTDVPVVGPCDGEVLVDGDRTVHSQAEADALCTGGPAHLTGNLTIDVGETATLGCLCEVDGQVFVGPSTGQAVSAPALYAVGGGLSLAASSAVTVDLPELGSVGGDLTLGGQRRLESLTLPELTAVGGSVLATDLGPMLSLGLPRLLDVGGAFVLTDSRIEALDAPRLRSVGGSVQIERMARLDDLEILQSLGVIGGDLVLNEIAVTRLDDMRGFEHITGTLRITGNPLLTSIDGFWWLLDVGGIAIQDNPTLAVVSGFDYLVATPDLTITGSPVLSAVQLVALQEVGPSGALTLVDLPILGTPCGNDDLCSLDLPVLATASTIHLEGTALVSLSSLAALSSVQALEVIGNPAIDRVDLSAFPAQLDHLDVEGNPLLTRIHGLSSLADIAGDLRVVDNAALVDVSGFQALATVGGEVEIDRALALTDLSTLGTLREIGGGFTLSAIGASSVLPLHGMESVGGDLTIRDNPDLRTTDAQSLADAIEWIGGDVIITGNLP